MNDAIRGLIARYEAGAELLAYAFQGLSPEHASARPGPGAWSLAELAAHMADSDLVGADRMKRVIAENEPTLYAYNQDAWIARLDSQTMPIEESVALFGMNRRWMARLLRQRPDADFARAGHHTERGRETLTELVTGYTAHLDYHLKFAYSKRTNLGIALYPRYSVE